jgi:ferritin
VIKKRMQDAMNDQIQHEIASAYLYLAMAADFHAKGLDGMAQWMKVQTQEEMVHAMRFFAHIDEAYAHEQFITGRIDELAKIAREENDNAALMMLQWFVNEQIEEEANVSKVIDLLKLVGDSGQGLLMADRELGARVFVPPPAGAAAAGAPA